jgi:hypothetical protein
MAGQRDSYERDPSSDSDPARTADCWRESQSHAYRSGNDRQKKAFGQQLAKDAGAAGA